MFQLHNQNLIANAVIFPENSWVKLEDFIFEQHGLGHLYARVLNDRHRGQAFSYGVVENVDQYILICREKKPVDFGDLNHLVSQSDSNIVSSLHSIFTAKLKQKVAPTQLMALALIKASDEKIVADDDLGIHRIARWAMRYQVRAAWLLTHREEAYARSRINWSTLHM